VNAVERDDVCMTWTKEAGDHLRDAFVVILVTGVAWLCVAALLVVSIFVHEGVPRIILGAWVLIVAISLMLPTPRARGLWLRQHELGEYKFKIAPIYPVQWAVAATRVWRRALRGGSRSS
jgi:hypothetical protein